MFEQIGTVIIVIVVLVVGAGLGLFAGFVLGRHKGQEMARGVKSEELEEAKTSLENARFENAELSARNAAAQAQIEGVNQQLAFAKSQLAQAQQAEQIRIQQERERAAAEAERKRQADAQAAEVKRAEQEARLKEQSKVLEASSSPHCKPLACKPCRLFVDMTDHKLSSRYSPEARDL